MANSIIPTPPARPNVTPIDGVIREPTGPTGSEIYDYDIGVGETVLAINQDRIFEAVFDEATLLGVFWDITNDGTLWSSIEPNSGLIGTNIIAMNVDSFINNGLVVLEASEPSAFDIQLRLFNGLDQIRRFENNGEIYIINRIDNDTVGIVEGAVGVNEAAAFRTFSVFDEEFVNNGILAIQAIDGQALGILAFNGANIINTVHGQILVEGAGAIAIRNEFTLDEAVENFGLIQAVSINEQAAIGVASVTGEFINHETGVLTAEIAFTGSGSATNAGEVNGIVNGIGFLQFENTATGVINGLVTLSGEGDTLTNSGTINGNVFANNGDDLVDNTNGTINGIIDLGLGRDTFQGSVMQDLVAGDSGSDVINGNGGDDLLIGGNNDDTLTGGDGNIQYANYQSQEQVIEYLNSQGFGEETYGTWFANSTSGTVGDGSAAAIDDAASMMLALGPQASFDPFQAEVFG